MVPFAKHLKTTLNLHDLLGEACNGQTFCRPQPSSVRQLQSAAGTISCMTTVPASRCVMADCSLITCVSNKKTSACYCPLPWLLVPPLQGNNKIERKDAVFRYGLAAATAPVAAVSSSHDEAPPPAAAAAAAEVRTAARGRHLSKRERAALKKGVTLEELDKQRAEAAATAEAALAAKASALAASTSADPLIKMEPGSDGEGVQEKRSAVGKKKAAAKYRHQDAEDAALLSEFHAAGGPAKSRRERREERKARRASKKSMGLEVCLPHFLLF
jgi:hypothetical protein